MTIKNLQNLDEEEFDPNAQRFIWLDEEVFQVISEEAVLEEELELFADGEEPSETD